MPHGFPQQLLLQGELPRPPLLLRIICLHPYEVQHCMQFDIILRMIILKRFYCRFLWMLSLALPRTLRNYHRWEHAEVSILIIYSCSNTFLGAFNLFFVVFIEAGGSSAAPPFPSDGKRWWSLQNGSSTNQPSFGRTRRNLIIRSRLSGFTLESKMLELIKFQLELNKRDYIYGTRSAFSCINFHTIIRGTQVNSKDHSLWAADLGLCFLLRIQLPSSITTTPCWTIIISIYIGAPGT